MKIRPFVTAAILVLASGAPLRAQWIDLPTPGIPRTADGKPNLSAPAPKTADGKPDLSGIWTMNAGRYAMNIAADLKPGETQPWAEALYQQRRENLGKDSPFTGCLPQGAALNLNPVAMIRVVQTPTIVAFLSEDLTYRTIHLDGRKLPVNPNPSFMGYAVGRWEGDTLVVESNGYNDRIWLDFGGHPHSEALHITERIRRSDFGHLEIEETLTDPAVFARPWTIKIRANFIADTEILEYVCAENESDRQHLVGTASDDKHRAVKVAPELLAKYAGTYDFRFPENPTQSVPVPIVLSDGQLTVDFFGDKRPLTPLSDTVFSSEGNPITFVTNDRGVVTHIIIQAAEGDLKANRMPNAK
jgi:hypothetical protein